jgi:hypothetical protein
VFSTNPPSPRQAYPISNHTILNIATTQPDTNFAAAPTATWTTRADKSAMLGVYADFCPRVVKLLRLVPGGEVCEWKLRVHHPLRTWVAGAVALVGDACHPTLPVSPILKSEDRTRRIDWIWGGSISGRARHRRLRMASCWRWYWASWRTRRI